MATPLSITAKFKNERNMRNLIKMGLSIILIEKEENISRKGVILMQNFMHALQIGEIAMFILAYTLLLRRIRTYSWGTLTSSFNFPIAFFTSFSSRAQKCQIITRKSGNHKHQMPFIAVRAGDRTMGNMGFESLILPI
ncbi:hypothetical protein ACJX0J_038066 [Zea mays]